MPVKQARPQSTVASAPSTQAPTTETPAPASNAEMVEKVKASQLSSGQLSWQDALGQTLGSKLYEQISDNLSDADLQDVAGKAVDSATDALHDFLKDNVDASEQQAAAVFVQALDTELTRIAKGAVSGDVGEAIRGFVDDNPYLVTGAIVAGAIAWVLSNQDIGMLDTRLKLGGGHSIVGGVDLGKTMDIAIEQVRLGYRYSGGGTTAEITADYEVDEERLSVLGSFERQIGAGTASLSGEHIQSPNMTSSRIAADFRSDNLSAGMWWGREGGVDGTQEAIGAHMTATGKDWSAHMKGMGRDDGSWEAAAGFNKSKGNASFGLEGYAGKDRLGVGDAGLRATFKWTF